MQAAPIQKVIIAGGGTAGWMTAAALAKMLRGRFQIELVESEEIGIVGVGEATIPMIKLFNQALGLDEDDFLRQAQGSFKLGIEFVDWGRVGDSYIHGFGRIGQDWGMLNFFQYWLRLHHLGEAQPLGDYSINTAAARAGKFMRAQTQQQNTPLADIGHAFHFDASLYARYLRGFAEGLGVRRTEGRIDEVVMSEQGLIKSLRVLGRDGQRSELHADLFVDCTGFQGLLIEGALKTGYLDWRHWLPCDRAWAVPCASAGPLLPYTRSTAREAGWQWRIPLQHRIGNGYVFSSAHIDEAKARELLLQRLDGAALAEPRLLKFVTGRRRQFWHRNCVAIGLSSGFMEPLESTSIHLIQSSIAKLLEFFPDQGFAQADIDEYNRQLIEEFEKIRDFLILHYHLTERDDTAFWRYCRTMSVPDSLVERMALFASHGRVYRHRDEMFTEMSWIQVMVGQGLVPKAAHPMVDVQSLDEIRAFASNVHHVLARCVDYMPEHQAFIDRFCKAQA